ncbi:hypothetical protein JCGZ_09474 [Jatropha curcas]|uniref:Uncharacterized protein n=1 Tax=Jatropha curcas TaxID=180498 RepID=A0A067KSR9_JATCU|nr:hypothetical protein JCGZ_09474 [Jatropha curcas]
MVLKSTIPINFSTVSACFKPILDGSGRFQVELELSIPIRAGTIGSRFQNWWNHNRTGLDRFQFQFGQVSVPTDFGFDSHRFRTDGSGSENRILATPAPSVFFFLENRTPYLTLAYVHKPAVL